MIVARTPACGRGIAAPGAVEGANGEFVVSG